MRADSRNRRSLPILLVVVAGLMLAAWCGRSGEPSSTGTQGLARNDAGPGPSAQVPDVDAGTVATGPTDGGVAPPDSGVPRPRESIAAVASCSYPQAPSSGCAAGVSCAPDQTYATIAGTPLTMDVFRPSSGGPYPLIVLMHGGGFTGGDKSDLTHDALVLAQQGFVTVSINYRLMRSDGTNSFPAAVQDARCALRVLRAGAKSWNLDPNRVGVYGISAGAVLSGILGTESDVGGLDDSSCPEASQPVTLQAVAPMYGAFDVNPGYPRGNDPAVNADAALWLHQPPDHPDIDTAASAIDHIDGNDPPFLLVHGDSDNSIPLAQSQRMLTALQNGGVPATLVTVADGHSFDPFDGAANHEQAACTVIAFFHRWL
jgi:acetyl esterase/lipase